MNKDILKVFIPGKWTLALFLVVFLVFFAWGTTFDKNSGPKDGSVIIDSSWTTITYSALFPWYPNIQNLADLIMSEITPILGQFSLIANFAGKSLWLGVYYNTLNFSLKEYSLVLVDYYCILISFEAGALFLISLLIKNAKEEQLWDSACLILYRSIIIVIIVFIFSCW